MMRRSPLDRSVPVALYLAVGDFDAVWRRAIDAGARVHWAPQSELQGAVALAKLDPILRDLRARHLSIKNRVALLAAARRLMAAPVGPDGDGCVALIAPFPDAATAKYVVKALKVERLPSMVLFDPDVIDYHAAEHRAPLLAHRSWSKVTPPWDRGDPSTAIRPGSRPGRTNC